MLRSKVQAVQDETTRVVVAEAAGRCSEAVGAGEALLTSSAVTVEVQMECLALEEGEALVLDLEEAGVVPRVDDFQ